MQGTYAIPDRLSVSLLYFGGVERPSGALEGQPWRHLFDAFLQVDAAKWLAFVAQGDAGFEDNRFGRSSWYAFAAYVRGQPHEKLYLAGRFDRFGERVAKSGEGTASSIFWPVPWMSSLTATVDVRPHPNVSVRAEYRHDMAGGNAFFQGTVTGDGSAASPFVPNAIHAGHRHRSASRPGSEEPTWRSRGRLVSRDRCVFSTHRGPRAALRAIVRAP